jgi:prefoldin subunit 5
MQYDTEQLGKELSALKERRELFMAQVNQIQGAIAIIEQMIATLNSPSVEEPKEEVPVETLPVEEAPE